MTAPPSTEPTLDLLRSVPMFEGLSEHDLSDLTTTLTPRRFPAGASVFSLGDPGDALYIVESGDVNIFLPLEESRRLSLKEVSRGEFFGELALFDDKPRSASAQASSPAVLLELRRETLAAYLDYRPRAAMAILQTMSERLRETNTMLSARAARDVDADFDEHVTWSDRLADQVAELNGSWTFILLLVGSIALWCIINTTLFLHPPYDPYPYEFFNLVLTIVVGLQGPLIVMSQNRKAAKDRARSDNDYQVNLKNEVNVETLMRELGEFRAEFTSRVDRLGDRVEEHRETSG